MPKNPETEPETSGSDSETDEFSRFRELTKKLVAVPKAKIDAARKAKKA